MAIKLTLLKSGEMLISDAKELVSDTNTVEPYAYVLDHPHVVLTTPKRDDSDQIDVLFKPWIIISKDTKMLVPTDWVVTIVDPIDSIKKMYIDKSKSFKKEDTKEEKSDGN